MSDYAVRLLYDVHGWAYYNRCKALERYRPPDWHATSGGNYGAEFKKRRYDIALQLCYGSARQIRRHVDNGNYPTQIVTGFNVAANSGRDANFTHALKYSHHVVVNSRKAWEAMKKPDRVTWISNGVDRAVYSVQVEPSKRTPRVLAIGSEFHKLNKGFRKILPEVRSILASKNIPCDFRCVNSHAINRMDSIQMAEWYNTGTVYVVASKNEGTPNPALEAASAGCVVVATPVGNMPELITDGVNGYLVTRKAVAIAAAVIKAQARYAEMQAAMEEAIQPWHWKIRATQYYDLFRRVADDYRESSK